jgi:2-iminobutanoate/2-iminopropanoate deaminase
MANELKKVSTSSAPAAIGPYSQAIIYGNILFTSGQIPINPATGNIETTTIEEQTEQVMKNLGAVLESAGTSFDKAIKTTCFLANISDFVAFNGVYAKYFTSKPARSCVAVKDLPKGALVEVEVIATID